MHKNKIKKLGNITIDNNDYIRYSSIIKCNRLQNKIEGGKNDF